MSSVPLLIALYPIMETLLADFPAHANNGALLMLESTVNVQIFHDCVPLSARIYGSYTLELCTASARSDLMKIHRRLAELRSGILIQPL